MSPTLVVVRDGAEEQSQVRLMLTFRHNCIDQIPRTLIVRLISTAQTGFFYTKVRPRLGPRLSAVKYDPVGASRRLLVIDLLTDYVLFPAYSEVQGTLRREQEDEEVGSFGLASTNTLARLLAPRITMRYSSLARLAYAPLHS